MLYAHGPQENRPSSDNPRKPPNNDCFAYISAPFFRCCCFWKRGNKNVFLLQERNFPPNIVRRKLRSSWVSRITLLRCHESKRVKNSKGLAPLLAELFHAWRLTTRSGVKPPGSLPQNNNLSLPSFLIISRLFQLQQLFTNAEHPSNGDAGKTRATVGPLCKTMFPVHNRGT